MSHLTSTRWHGYATEARRVELTITSDLTAGDIAEAELRIAGRPVVPLTPESATGGYKLTADPVTLPPAGFYQWSAEVTDDDGNAPIIVAVGLLDVDPRTAVAAT